MISGWKSCRHPTVKFHKLSLCSLVILHKNFTCFCVSQKMKSLDFKGFAEIEVGNLVHENRTRTAFRRSLPKNNRTERTTQKCKSVMSFLLGSTNVIFRKTQFYYRSYSIHQKPFPPAIILCILTTSGIYRIFLSKHETHITTKGDTEWEKKTTK